MRDQHDDRIYQAFRNELGTNVAQLVRSVAYAFERLQARLYDAPWSRPGALEKSCKANGFTII